MCIIAAKKAGVAMPSTDIIETMWINNSDGAGIMWVENNRVNISKGFMKLSDFKDFINTLDERVCLDKTSVVMHFRITTHGGTKPENCHPFPITENVGFLKKLEVKTNLGVAHNGVIDITPRTGISDTMEYIASQLSIIKKLNSKFYLNSNFMQLIENAIESKMAFLNTRGEIYTIGAFNEVDGILYSNKSYEPKAYVSKIYSNWDYNGWDYSETYDLQSNEVSKNIGNEDEYDVDYIKAQSVYDESGYVIKKNGELAEDDFFIDKERNVYIYNIYTDSLSAIEGATAYNAQGMPMSFDVEKSTILRVIKRNDVGYKYEKIKLTDIDGFTIGEYENISIEDAVFEAYADIGGIEGVDCDGDFAVLWGLDGEEYFLEGLCK